MIWVWSTRYSPVFLSVSALPCLALLDLLKTVNLSLSSSLCSSFLPAVCTVTAFVPTYTFRMKSTESFVNEAPGV